MLEKDFQKWIVDLAVTLGWRVWHVPTPMKPVGGNRFVPDPRGRGLADLILMHDTPPRLIFAELKAVDGVTSDEQEEFLRLARGVSSYTLGRDDHRTVGAYLWRPGMEAFIETILRGRILVAA